MKKEVLTEDNFEAWIEERLVELTKRNRKQKRKMGIYATLATISLMVGMLCFIFTTSWCFTFFMLAMFFNGLALGSSSYRAGVADGKLFCSLEAYRKQLKEERKNND